MNIAILNKTVNLNNSDRKQRHWNRQTGITILFRYRNIFLCYLKFQTVSTTRISMGVIDYFCDQIDNHD